MYLCSMELRVYGCLHTVRHVACSLVLLCNALQPSANVFLKHITVRVVYIKSKFPQTLTRLLYYHVLTVLLQMATKTGRAWLGEESTPTDSSLCVYYIILLDCDNSSMADTSLLLATEVRLHTSILPFCHVLIPSYISAGRR